MEKSDLDEPRFDVFVEHELRENLELLSQELKSKVDLKTILTTYQLLKNVHARIEE